MDVGRSACGVDHLGASLSRESCRSPGLRLLCDAGCVSGLDKAGEQRLRCATLVVVERLFCEADELKGGLVGVPPVAVSDGLDIKIDESVVPL